MYDRKNELRRQGAEFMAFSNSNHEFNHSSKVFGTKKEVKGAEHIGSEVIFKNPSKETHWHIDRRKKKGTIADRKK